MPMPVATNINCLEGLACPHCGSQDAFDIDVRTTVRMHDNGTEHMTDAEWDAESAITCTDCNHRGTAGQFSIAIEGQPILTETDIKSIFDVARPQLGPAIIRSEIDADDATPSRLRSAFGQLHAEGSLPTAAIAGERLCLDASSAMSIVRRALSTEA